MRPLILSVVACLALAGLGEGQQSGGSSSGVSALPVGQVTKEFKFPIYENDQLKFTMTASQATGVTINRAEALDLKIDIYENGNVTTTITSPDADLYVTERKMRTRNTVKIDRTDLTATAKFCDFDLTTKQYTMRTNVKVVLKNFDMAKAVPKPNVSTNAAPSAPTAPDISSAPSSAADKPVPSASAKIDALLESPGMFSSTNVPPAH